jgi:hypothetical protein
LRRGVAIAHDFEYLPGPEELMARFDSRNSKKMRQRKSQAKKKARDKRRAETVHAERAGKKKTKKK